MMTFEQLKSLEERANQGVLYLKEAIQNTKALYKMQEQKYINERLPFPFQERQVVEVSLKVTEATRERLDKHHADNKRYALGRVYTRTGMLMGYQVGEQGELRPKLRGNNGWYSPFDDVLSIKLGKQRSERCKDCLNFQVDGCHATRRTEPDFDTNADSYICEYFILKK